MQNHPNPMDLHYDPINLDPQQRFAVMLDYPLPQTTITSMHKHNCLEIGYCHSGFGVFVVEDKAMEFSEGDVCVITEYEFHRAQSLSHENAMWSFVSSRPRLLFGPDSVAFGRTEHLTGSDFRNILPHEQSAQLRPFLQMIFDEKRRREVGYPAAVQALLQSIFVQLHRYYPPKAEAEDFTERREMIARVSDAIQLITQRYSEQLSLEELASCCNMSVTHFRRIFTQATGKSPKDYLTGFRVQMASVLLRTFPDRPMEDISLEVGFAAPSSLFRHFKRIMGVAPSAWRR